MDVENIESIFSELNNFKILLIILIQYEIISPVHGKNT